MLSFMPQADRVLTMGRREKHVTPQFSVVKNQAAGCAAWWSKHPFYGVNKNISSVMQLVNKSYKWNLESAIQDCHSKCKQIHRGNTPAYGPVLKVWTRFIWRKPGHSRMRKRSTNCLKEIKTKRKVKHDYYRWRDCTSHISETILGRTICITS